MHYLTRDHKELNGMRNRAPARIFKSSSEDLALVFQIMGCLERTPYCQNCEARPYGVSYAEN